MFASVPSAVLFCAEGHLIHVEVQVSSGLPGFSLVGLPDTSIRESRDRAACRGAEQRIALAQAQDHREPRTIGRPQGRIRSRSGDRRGGARCERRDPTGGDRGDGVHRRARSRRFAAPGQRRRARWSAPSENVTSSCRSRVRPRHRSSRWAGCVPSRTSVSWSMRCSARRRGPITIRFNVPSPLVDPPPDLADVQGQPVARHALEVAAAGGHHTLFIGPPGAGKTMLASRLPGLLPPLDRDHGARGHDDPLGIGYRPAVGWARPARRRSGHRTTPRRRIALVGGGSQFIRPGEVSIAHGGVLFMDELAEFSPSVLDGLRQPLESRVVHVSRAEVRAVLPGRLPAGRRDEPVPVRWWGAGSVHVR